MRILTQLVCLLSLTLSLVAQTKDFGTVFKGPLDASTAPLTAPNRTGSGAPASPCTGSETYQRTDVPEIWNCIGNQWKLVGGKSAAQIASAVEEISAATSALTPGALARRDSAGNLPGTGAQNQFFAFATPSTTWTVTAAQHGCTNFPAIVFTVYDATGNVTEVYDAHGVNRTTGAVTATFSSPQTGGISVNCSTQPNSNKTGLSGNKTIFLGDSITWASGGLDVNGNTYFTSGWIYQASIRSKGAVQLLANAGISGQTTAQIAARFPADVVAKNPDKVVILCGTNDLPGVTAGTTTLASLSALMTGMIQAAKQNNIQPIVGLIPPNPPNNRNAAVRVNAIWRAVADAQRVPVVDFYSVLADGAGNWKSASYTSDNTHPTAIGARIMADKFLADTALLYTPPRPWLTQMDGDPANILPNGLFLQATTASGQTVATGWGGVGFGTATVPAYSFVTDASILGRWYQAVIPAATGTWEFGPGTINTGWSVGDRVAISGRIQISGLEASGSSGCSLKVMNSVYALFNYAADIADGAFYLEQVVPANAVSVSANFVCNAGANGPITVRLAQMGIYNLTANGQ